MEERILHEEGREMRNHGMHGSAPGALVLPEYKV